MKAAGYIRVSTDEQAKSGLGLEAQEKKIRAYAELFDIELTEIVSDEGISGKTLKRPGLQKVLAQVQNKEVEGIIVAKLDRLTRSVSDMGTLVASTFNTAELFSVSEQVDTRTAAGRLVLNVLVSVGQWERETIVERTKDALAQKKNRQEKTGGIVPYGKKLVDGKLVEEEAEQQVIDYIHRLRAEGTSYNRIAEALNMRKIKTKTNKIWHASTILNITKIAA